MTALQGLVLVLVVVGCSELFDLVCLLLNCQEPWRTAAEEQYRTAQPFVKTHV